MQLCDVKEKIIIHFISMDQKIKYSITCYTTDVFSKIIKRICFKFPELEQKVIHYIANGAKIEELNNTLLVNNIQNNTTILMCYN